MLWQNALADPNRPGMHMKLIKFLLKLKAPRIVYVSCNPATCARDLDYLCHGMVHFPTCPTLSYDWYCLDIRKPSFYTQEDKRVKGLYKLKSVQPVDMFPHTPHIECVCLLELAWSCWAVTMALYWVWLRCLLLFFQLQLPANHFFFVWISHLNLLYLDKDTVKKAEMEIPLKPEHHDQLVVISPFHLFLPLPFITR